MPSDHQLKTLSTVALMLCLALLPAAALADQRHCPASMAENSHVICPKGCDPDVDKARLITLAKEIAKRRPQVCLLALVDPKDAGYSRKLAIKRVLWVRDTLIEHGVRSSSVAVELRPFLPGADKASLQSVTIILGR